MRFAQTDIPDSKIRGVARRLFGAVGYNDAEMVQRIMADYNCVGYCKRCKINLYGNVRPSEKTMPCGVVACPFEQQQRRRVAA